MCLLKVMFMCSKIPDDVCGVFIIIMFPSKLDKLHNCLLSNVNLLAPIHWFPKLVRTYRVHTIFVALWQPIKKDSYQFFYEVNLFEDSLIGMIHKPLNFNVLSFWIVFNAVNGH